MVISDPGPDRSRKKCIFRIKNTIFSTFWDIFWSLDTPVGSRLGPIPDPPGWHRTRGRVTSDQTRTRKKLTATQTRAWPKKFCSYPDRSRSSQVQMFNTALYLYPTHQGLTSDLTWTGKILLRPDRSGSSWAWSGRVGLCWAGLGRVGSKCSRLHCTWTRRAGSNLRPNPDPKKLTATQTRALTRKILLRPKPVRVGFKCSTLVWSID